MRSNYVRSFYLPEHQPAPPTHSSHIKSRIPSYCSFPNLCDCGRKKQVSYLCCEICNESRLAVECAQQQKLLPAVVVILKPVRCTKCGKRFAGKDSLKTQMEIHKQPQKSMGKASSLIPKCMSVDQLK